ncbi:MAG TPA: hypothetical protein VMX58_00450 [Patescibacteria group bacterium]|nr:hypothetical protein [Patescibacteria group bacterium]
MHVSCSLCGGENEIHPGQKMLLCSYCGSSLAVDALNGPEHLILPHERNDRHAGEELCSFLLARRMPRPKDIKVDFSYTPFLAVEDEKGRAGTIPGSADPPAGASTLPYPPAGCYRFFDEALAGAERIVPVERTENGTTRILHIPVYRMLYTAAGGTWRATVIGESWQVHADEYPPERPSIVNMQNVLIAAGILAAYLFIGKLGHGWLSRFVVTFAAAAMGYVFLALKRKVTEKR